MNKREYLTFGHGREFYILFAPTLSAFLGITNAVIASLPFVPPDLLQWTGFYVLTVAFTVALFLQMRYICERTLSPRLNQTEGKFLSFTGYLVIPLLIEYIVYTLVMKPESILPAPNMRDIAVAVSLASIYAMFIAGRHYFKSVSHLPHPYYIEEKIDDFKQAGERAQKSDIGDVQEKFEEVHKTGEELSQLLEEAQTSDGRQLQAELTNWLESFNNTGKGPGSKQSILDLEERSKSDQLSIDYQSIIIQLDKLGSNR